MATAADLRALEALTSWDSDDFRAGVAELRTSTAREAQQYARDARTLSRLAALVPRCANDDRGGTPWTSFRRDVAVARRISDQGAAAQIRTAGMLTSTMPRTLALLDDGAITAQRARVFATELERLDDDVVRRIDRDQADRVAGLPPWRIRDEVRRAALVLDPETAAARSAAATADRDVRLQSGDDDQACIVLTGPAVPLVRWWATLDAQARALRQAGDPRTLANLRFDLATSAFPCTGHAPAAPYDQSDGAAGAWLAPAGLRPNGVEAASVDCRRARPVQAMVLVPVETALGLSSEPAWLDGYGWISAPVARELLVDAELRRVCVQTGTGQVVDVADRDVRPPPGPVGVRRSVLDMVLDRVHLSDSGWRVEPEHDPSPALAAYVRIRDRGCDGPTGAQVTARRCHLDHEEPHPHGPTAAWNLTARAERTHALKHYGWTPLRTTDSTLWFSPAGQLVEVPHLATPSPGIDQDPDGWPAVLPDALELADVDRRQLTAVDRTRPAGWREVRPEPTAWTWLGSDEPAAF